MRNRSFAALCAASLWACPALAADQTKPGEGNATAAEISAASPLVARSIDYLVEQARRIRDPHLRAETLDAIANPNTCIRHRAGLSAADKAAIVQTLVGEGLVNAALDKTQPGGLLAGVFPPVADDGTSCPKLPMPFGAAPGSSFHSHHAFPGGLAVHESFNERSDQSFAQNYRRNYRSHAGSSGEEDGEVHELASGIFVDEDLIIAAPLWHDWSKPIVFQWAADGTEFLELNIGGAGGGTDGFGGAAGDSQTGGHHILAVAEAMARGFSPEMIVTQASAHSNPTLGNEFKVVNWVRAAAVIARVDPLKAGYLVVVNGIYRLPPLRRLASGVDLVAAGQLNFLPEYSIHNLSDSDFTLTIPAVNISEAILPKLAPLYGYDPADTVRYNWKFRNTVLSNVAGERILFAYQAGGLAEVQKLIDALRATGKL